MIGCDDDAWQNRVLHQRNNAQHNGESIEPYSSCEDEFNVMVRYDFAYTTAPDERVIR